MATFGYRSTADEVLANIDLGGKRAIVTGGYSGLGEETARALASAGAEVTIACRDLPRAEATAQALNDGLGASRVTAGALDLSDLDSVQRFAADWSAAHDALHLLINNAAVMACPLSHTKAGHEMQIGTNHFGHFALFQGLRERLAAAQGARVVCLSSTGHFLSDLHLNDLHYAQREYEPWQAYGQSKTANALMAVGIQRQHASDGIEGFAVHPGGIMTSLQRHMDRSEIIARGWMDEAGNINELFKTVPQGASTTCWAATAPELSGRGGQYLENCSETPVITAPTPDFTGVMAYAVDPDAADALWAHSLEQIA
ncbi:MAG: SDR family NAD(P)-dependent oxidoreductase [Pseudomonadota bacterium]